MSSNVVKTTRQLRVPESHRVGAISRAGGHQASEEAIRHIVEEATQEAEAIMAKAQAQAQAVLETAREQGREEGREAVWQELRAATEVQWEPVRAALAEIFGRVERISAWLELCQDPATLALARLMADSILTAAVRERPEWFADYLGQVIETLRVDSVRLAVGEAWAEQTERLIGLLTPVVGVAEAFVDRALPPFEVRIESEGVAAVAGIKTALDQIEDEVRYGDRSFGV